MFEGVFTVMTFVDGSLKIDRVDLEIVLHGEVSREFPNGIFYRIVYSIFV